MMFIENFGEFRLSKVPFNLIYMDRMKFQNTYNGFQLSLNTLSFAFAKEILQEKLKMTVDIEKSEKKDTLGVSKKVDKR